MSCSEHATMEEFLFSPSLVTEEEKDLPNHPYPFENLVFQGGGVKGIAYGGAIKVLKDVGILKKIKRFGGTSVGAMVACMLAVGVDENPHDVIEALEKRLKAIAVDHSWGWFSFIPNILRFYGWNPGQRMYKWFGEELRKRGYNEDITFRELYQKTRKELCIVVCNLTRMEAEYCHVKTTPNLPVRLAVRMSIAVPGFYEAVPYTRGQVKELYVDGGLLVNYPVFCYDGWWLSLKYKDNIFRKITLESKLSHILEMSQGDRFKGYNEKTLGIMLCSQDNPVVFGEYKVESNEEDHPNTTLWSERSQITQDRRKEIEKNRKVSEALGKFFEMWEKHLSGYKMKISKEELDEALKKYTDFTDEDRMTLFNDTNIDKIFEKLDQNGDKKITEDELATFGYRHGFENLLVGYGHEDISTLTEFLKMLTATVFTNLKDSNVKENDVNRSVVIDVDYLRTLDFDMEPGDRLFAVKRGANATKKFLLNYVRNHPAKKKGD